MWACRCSNKHKEISFIILLKLTHDSDFLFVWLIVLCLVNQADFLSFNWNSNSGIFYFIIFFICLFLITNIFRSVDSGEYLHVNYICIFQKFDGNEFLMCLKKLISIDKDWVPQEENCSLYIRPTFIATEVRSVKLFSLLLFC